MKARSLLAALALVALASAAQPAQAQWAVIDPAHIAKSVHNGIQIMHQLRAQRDQLQAFRDQVVGLSRFEFRDVGAFVAGVDRAIASGEALAYATRDLDRAFAAAYAGDDPEDSHGAADAYVQRRLDGALGALRSLRDHAAQIGGARRDVERLQAQLRTADTAQQVAEVQASIGAYQAQEMQMVRQMLMLQANQTANDQAQEAARFQYSREAARALTARTRRDVARMGGRDYRGSIFDR